MPGRRATVDSLPGEAAEASLGAVKKALKQRTLALSGHTHSKELFEPCGSYNVAIDAHECHPVSLDQIIDDFKVKYPFGQK